jgi:hypothetical protein
MPDPKENSMKPHDLSEAQIAWILWNLHERFNTLLWDRYEKEFLDWRIMDEAANKEMERRREEELDRLFDPESL